MCLFFHNWKYGIIQQEIVGDDYYDNVRRFQRKWCDDCGLTREKEVSSIKVPQYGNQPPASLNIDTNLVAKSAAQITNDALDNVMSKVKSIKNKGK